LVKEVVRLRWAVRGIALSIKETWRKLPI